MLSAREGRESIKRDHHRKEKGGNIKTRKREILMDPGEEGMDIIGR